MATTRTPRASWIDEGLQALASGGPDAVRVEPLAQVLGVTKGGFYWHFADRAALLEEMLDAWERVMVDEVIDRVESQGGNHETGWRACSRSGRRGRPGPCWRSTWRCATGRAATDPSARD